MISTQFLYTSNLLNNTGKFHFHVINFGVKVNHQQCRQQSKEKNSTQCFFIFLGFSCSFIINLISFSTVKTRLLWNTAFQNLVYKKAGWDGKENKVEKGFLFLGFLHCNQKPTAECLIRHKDAGTCPTQPAHGTLWWLSYCIMWFIRKAFYLYSSHPQQPYEWQESYFLACNQPVRNVICDACGLIHSVDDQL